MVARWAGSPPNILYLNTDDGSGGRTFDDITVSAGLDVAPSLFWQCVMADFNGDEWIDIYQAADAFPDRLWRARLGTVWRLEV